MKNLNSKILIFFLILSLLLPVAMPAYADYNPVLFRLTSLGIIENYEEEHIVTRGEAVYSFVKFLIDEIPVGTQPFSDVPLEHKYKDAISCGVGVGMVSGVPGGLFHPDDPVLGVQLAKMAVITLGYGAVAESEGGYDGGYKAVATRLGLLTGFDLNGTVTMKQFVSLLDKMLETYPLVPVWGTNEHALSPNTMLETVLQRTKALSIKNGLVTAAEKAALNGYSELKEDKISIDGEAFAYYGGDASSFFGRSVDAYYKADSVTGENVIIAMMPRYNNEELYIKNEDVIALSKTACTYALSADKIETVSISLGASFIYNGKNYTPESGNITLYNGNVTLIDHNGDSTIDVVFIDEYESAIIDRISTGGGRIFFKDNTPFRGKNVFEFDFDDKDKEYFITNENGDEITFDDIKEGMVITIKSSFDETINHICVTDKTVEGVISEIDATEAIFTINGEHYPVYAQYADRILSRYNAGQNVLFYLNSLGEIVDGEIGTDGAYGYILATHQGSGLGGNIQIRVATSGVSNKHTEVVDKQEIISYEYTNELKTYDLAASLDFGIADDNGNISMQRVACSKIDCDILQGAAVCYKLDTDGKINYLAVTPINFAGFKNSVKYTFNATLNSFGGISTSKAFFIGKGTNVICIPNMLTATEEDFTVDVTLTDDTSQTIMPLGIDEETQIAQCAILMASMKGSDVKPFTITTKYSIVGGVKKVFDENGDARYKMDVLTDDEFSQPTIMDGELKTSVVAALKCGDLIRFNTKSNGEISNIQKVTAMYDFGDVYAENLDGTVFGQVADIQLNRLDDFLNEMVDIVTFEDLGSGSKTFKILRDDGPVVYSYRKSTGVIKAAETDEIYAGQELFLLQSDNVVKAVVIFED